jgi:hypothetical protein
MTERHENMDRRPENVRANHADQGLRERARRAIEAGRVPRWPPESTWGGSGAGEDCAVCDRPVARDELELEVSFAGHGRGYHFHVRCLAAWESVCRDVEAEIGPVEPALGDRTGQNGGVLWAAPNGPTMGSREPQTTSGRGAA